MSEANETYRTITPLPWRLEEEEIGDCDAGPDGQTVSWGTGEYGFSGCIVTEYDKQTGEYDYVAEQVSENDARYIVAAVNAHEAMTDLAKTVELVCNVRGPITQDARRMLLDKAALALAKAKEPEL